MAAMKQRVNNLKGSEYFPYLLYRLTLIYAVSSVQRGSVGPGVAPDKLLLPSIVTSRVLGNFCPKYQWKKKRIIIHFQI